MTPRKKAVKKLDKVFSLYIRQRDMKCVICGSTSNLQCGHLLTRAAYSTRWDENNCFANCRNCNLRHEYQPHHFTQWYIKKFGMDAYDKLIFKHGQTSKLSTNELEILIKYYEGKLTK